MARFCKFIATALAIPLAVAAADAADSQPHPPVPTDVEVKLDASDLEAITMEILSRNPILSASPGIKYVHALQMHPTGVWAQVIYFPHAESRGIREAIQAHCERDSSSSPWSCPSVELRRYVKLDTQDFEVRVIGQIDLDGILALTEATRPIAMNAVPGTVLETVTCIYALHGGHFVGWGSFAERAGVTIQAVLKPGGNTSNPADWNAYLLDENGGRAE